MRYAKIIVKLQEFQDCIITSTLYKSLELEVDTHCNKVWGMQKPMSNRKKFEAQNITLALWKVCGRMDETTQMSLHWIFDDLLKLPFPRWIFDKSYYVHA